MNKKDSYRIERYYAGCYQATLGDRTFLIERMSAVSDEDIHKNDNTWMLCEIVNGDKEYWSHFATKRDAVKAVKNG